MSGSTPQPQITLDEHGNFLIAPELAKQFEKCTVCKKTSAYAFGLHVRLHAKKGFILLGCPRCARHGKGACVDDLMTKPAWARLQNMVERDWRRPSKKDLFAIPLSHVQAAEV